MADVIGICGGGAAATSIFGLPFATFFSAVRDGITSEDIIGGVIKPFVFALIIGSIACYKGLSTGGGTVGVGRSTTSSVVTSSIIVIVTDFFLAKLLQAIFGVQTP
jgi:phospholipid/cholesterol/gamma-HCH transport system permease protein